MLKGLFPHIFACLPFLEFFEESVSVTINTLILFSHSFYLTLIPSNRDKALKGLKALNVRSDLMAPSSE